MSDVLTRIRANIKEALDERTAKQAELDDLIDTIETEGRTDLKADEAEKVKELRSALVAKDEKITELRAREAEFASIAEARKNAEALADQYAPAGPAVEERKVEARIDVKREELTYRQGGHHSYFADLAKASDPAGFDTEARSRLQRHRAEMDVELRANMNRTDNTGGEFVPPLWLMDQYVPLARAGRVTADLCRKLPLPPGTDTVSLPKVSTGTAAAEQSDGSSVQKTDMTTTSVTGAVTTMAGQQVFAMQLLDQSPAAMDEVVFADLLADLAKQVDAYVINKASIGILNVTGIVSVSYTDASPTVAELYPKVADAKQQIDTNRFLPAQAIVMHPRRWGWLLASEDGNSRPLVVPSAQGPQNAFAGVNDVRSEGSVGTLHSLPVYIDANVPTTLGGGTEDAIILARFDDLFLYEGSIRTRVLFETDADTLSVRLQVWEYLAFIGGRYPKSIAKVTGTGLAAPTF